MTTLTTHERSCARQVAEALSRKHDQASLVVDGQRVVLPEEVAAALAAAARELGAGRDVEVVASDKVLSTGQAAALLGLSRTYMVELLDRGELPSERPGGSHRRVKLRDILEYKERRRQDRRAGLDALAQLDEELGLND